MGACPFSVLLVSVITGPAVFQGHCLKHVEKYVFQVKQQLDM